MGRFKAVLLDVGGTMLRMGDPAAAYREILAEHGYTLEEEAVGRALIAAREAALAVPAGPLPDLTIAAEREFTRRDRLVCELLERLGVADRFEACRDSIWSSWLGTAVFHQYEETASVLARLKEQGYVIGAVSNWEPRLEMLLASHALRDYFAFILSSEAEGYVKPGPFLFQKALRLAGVSPDQALHVGDSYREDVEPARALGLSAVLLARDASRSAGYSPTIRSLEELFPLLAASDWIQGRVVSGEGEAARFTEIPWVRQQLQKRLGFVSYPGTLNLRLSSLADQLAFNRLKAGPGLLLEPEPGFCAGRCFEVVLEGHLAAAVVVPEVPGYPADLLELLAPVRLRDELGLVDDSPLTLAVVPPAAAD
jgi:putative hydrolase of the HAD superfamily